jgi:hypothetical protein
MIEKLFRQICLGLFAALFVTQVYAEDPSCEDSCPVPNFCCQPEVCCNNFWIDADYLYWKIQDSPKTIPLVIQAPAGSTTTPFLGEPGSFVVLGHKKINNEWRSGGRFALGYWFDNDECCGNCYGAEVNYFFLPEQSKRRCVFSTGSSDSPILAVPYFDVTTDEETSFEIAFPNRYEGRASYKLSNSMQNAELNGLLKLPCTWGVNLVALAGFRWWNFDEKFHFETSSPFVPPLPLDVFRTIDRFKAENNYYSGQIGIIGSYNCGALYANVKGKIAFGANCEDLRVKGRFFTNDFDSFGEVQEFFGGFFALPTNHGHHKRTKFAVLPEVDVNIGYQFSDCARVQIGYTFIYVSEVLRAGKQLSRFINPTQSVLYEEDTTTVLVGVPAPRARHKSESLWVQGLNVGVEFTF